MAEVTQADRDAAADFIEEYWSGADANMLKLAKDYRAGHSQGTFVRAFAAHREAAEKAERQAVVTWLRTMRGGAKMPEPLADAIARCDHRKG